MIKIISFIAIKLKTKARKPNNGLYCIPQLIVNINIVCNNLIYLEVERLVVINAVRSIAKTVGRH